MSSVSSTFNSQSNFERMLHSLTPRFPSRSVPENHVEALNKIWNPVGKPITQYYILGDLWDSLEKWSACGAGTRVEIYDNDDLMQYFVPHLSAIQIFTLKSPENLKIREDIDTIEVEDELWSDESDGEKSTGSATSNAWDNTSGDSNIDSEDWMPMKKNLKNLYLEFCETCSPYVREPLYDKVLHLSKDYPGLMTLRSTDLSPASWMAISWYPIYHIPAQEYMVDMSSAFLTFHTLSSLFQDTNDDEDTLSGGRRQSISLPSFGVAAYKFKGDIWFDRGDSDCAVYQDLNHAADSWLKQLNFDHHDFKFFSLKAAHVCNDACSCHSGEYYGSFY